MLCLASMSKGKPCRVCGSTERYAGTSRACKPCTIRRTRERRERGIAARPSLKDKPCVTCGATDRYGPPNYDCKPCAHAREREAYAHGGKRERLAAYYRRPDVRARQNAARKKRRAEDPEWRRSISLQHRRNRYGIDVIEELKACGNCCPICHRKFGDFGTRFGKREETMPHADHDHETGIFRSLLCATCNLMLGYAKDNAEILASAIEYLAKHKAKKAQG